MKSKKVSIQGLDFLDYKIIKESMSAFKAFTCWITKSCTKKWFQVIVQDGLSWCHHLHGQVVANTAKNWLQLYCMGGVPLKAGDVTLSLLFFSILKLEKLIFQVLRYCTYPAAFRTTWMPGSRVAKQAKRGCPEHMRPSNAAQSLAKSMARGVLRCNFEIWWLYQQQKYLEVKETVQNSPSFIGNKLSLFDPTL